MTRSSVWFTPAGTFRRWPGATARPGAAAAPAGLGCRGTCLGIVRVGCQGRTLADEQSHAGVAFPRLNRAGPRACLSQPGIPDRTRGRMKLVGQAAAGPPCRGVVGAAGRAVSMASADSARGCSAVTAGGAPSASMSTNGQKGPDSRVRRCRLPGIGRQPGPEPALCTLPLTGVRTPALALCALARPAGRLVPRRAAVTHLP
jgi:hypothetical protein